jgi:putative ABC transport system permease protein
MIKQDPPKWPLRFLRWFCREEYLDEIEGDLVELFEKRCEKSPRKAKWRFVWDVLKSFRIRNIKPIQRSQNANTIAMLQHTLLLALRNFKKYKNAFLINLIGLTSGLACALLIFLWVSDELAVDKFHENDERLYQVMENSEQAQVLLTSSATSGPMASSMVREIPEIEYSSTSWSAGNVVLSAGGNIMKASGKYVSNDFFKMFSFKVVQGDKNSLLTDKSSMVISEELALKLFNTLENVVGREVELRHERRFRVSGVFETVPRSSSLKFDFVLPYEVYSSAYNWINSWNSTGPQAYVLLKEQASPDNVNEALVDFVVEKTEGNVKNRIPFIVKFSDGYLYGNYQNGVQNGGRIDYVNLFSVVAIFILLIACINFMNLSTAKASRRIKEVGVKKAVGASRISLIGQYFGESFLMVVLSLLVAMAVVWVLLPQFNEVTGKNLTLVMGGDMLTAILFITFVTGLLSGSYPALYLSGFNPASVLRGGLKGSVGELWVRKGLVIFQFTLSIMLITSVLVVYKQIEFLQTKNLGYERDNLISIRKEGKLSNSAHAESFLGQLRNIPGVKAASGISSSLTRGNYGTFDIVWPGKNLEDMTEFENISVDYGMIEALGTDIKDGRSFSKEYGADSAKIIFNETAIQFMGMQDPVGKTIRLFGQEMQIIGVVKDFHFESLHETIKPLFFRLSPENAYTLMAKMESGKEAQTLQDIQALYEEFNPGFPFEYQFVDEKYQALYAAEQRVSLLSRYFAALAILISCLGLFGLAAFSAERPKKEIGIRKILGAKNSAIVRILSVDFTKMVVLAIAVALPVSYFLANSWLQAFAFRIELEWWHFAVAGISALFVAWLTVGIQTMKAARVSPVNSLRTE